jgi:hypothetical protein
MIYSKKKQTLYKEGDEEQKRKFITEIEEIDKSKLIYIDEA